MNGTRGASGTKGCVFSIAGSSGRLRAQGDITSEWRLEEAFHENSTNRHISQGIVDVLEETWDENAKSLSGRSRVVAGDPYELRIVTPFQTAGARAEEISVDCGDPEPRLQQDGDNVRATFVSPTSGEVRWQIRFKMGNTS